MKYITVSGEDITGVYDEINGNVPVEAIPIVEEIYEKFRHARYGFGEFIYKDNQVVGREMFNDHDDFAQRRRGEPYGVEDLVMEILTLLEVSNVICKDNLSFRARSYLGIPDSPPNTFGKALGHPEFNGIGGDLV